MKYIVVIQTQDGSYKVFKSVGVGAEPGLTSFGSPRITLINSKESAKRIADFYKEQGREALVASINDEGGKVLKEESVAAPPTKGILERIVSRLR